jgi:hypothetical protein
MGLCEEQQKKALELRNMTNGRSGAKESLEATGTDGASCNPLHRLVDAARAMVAIQQE